jgi:hypothetical protein
MLRCTPLGSRDVATYIAMTPRPNPGPKMTRPGRFATFLPQVEMAFNAWSVLLCRLRGIVKPIED